MHCPSGALSDPTRYHRDMACVTTQNRSGKPDWSDAGVSVSFLVFSARMYGTLICQVVCYFQHFPNDLKHIKILVGLIFFASSVGILVNIRLIWYYSIQRGLGVDQRTFLSCDHWSVTSFFIPSEVTCFLAEVLFLKRMWTLSNRKYPTIIALVPFTLGWAFTIAYIQGMFRHRCYPDMRVNRPYLFSSYGFRLCSDGIIAGTMCSLLYRQTSGMPIRNRPNFVRIVNSLVLWTISTGLLMWLSAIAFVLTYILLPNTWVALGIYLVRGNIYANAVLALLHARTRYRRVADEVISLQVDLASKPGGAREDRGQ